MAPPKKSSTKSSKAASRTRATATRKSGANTAAAKRSSVSAPQKAARTAKKAVEPVTRVTGAATRTAPRRTDLTTKRDSRQHPDAIRVLTNDHRQLEELFARFERSGDGAHKQRQDLVQRITEALSVHAAIEEEIFYPAARRSVADAADDVLEGLEEHHLVKLTLAELEMMDPRHERYGAKVTVLIENVRHHVEEEEGELFPTVRKALDPGQLRRIGADLVAAKRTAPTRPHPEAPDTPPGNIVAKVLTAPLDAVANLNKAAAGRVRDLVS